MGQFDNAGRIPRHAFLVTVPAIFVAGTRAD